MTKRYHFSWIEFDEFLPDDLGYAVGTIRARCLETGGIIYVNKDGIVDDTAFDMPDEVLEAAIIWASSQEQRSHLDLLADHAYNDYMKSEQAASDAWASSKRYLGY